jgi:hypothetical protein
VFLFDRGFMDYHADRFVDHSLLIEDGTELLALLPASERSEGADRVLVSHGGLTYGGFVVGPRFTVGKAIETMGAVVNYLREVGVHRLLYKSIPFIYAKYPCQEDLYALHGAGARLVRRDVSSAIDQTCRLAMQERRLRGSRKASKAGVIVRECQNYEAYWHVLGQKLLERHGVKPVHSLDEIRMLAARFPKNIRLFGAFREDTLVAGVLMFVSDSVAHAQYIASSDEGRDVGALDLLFAWLIGDVFAGKPYFDFGISTEDGGKVVNRGLLDQKEGFGGRAVVHDFYELETR